MRKVWTTWKQHQVLVRWAVTVALAVYALSISATAKDAVDGVQAARAESIRLSCQEQNERHDNTIRRLDVLLDKAIAKQPKRRAQIQQSRASTIFLISALVPKRDCEKRVEKLLNP